MQGLCCYSLKNKHYERYLEITTFFIQIISMYAVAIGFLNLYSFFKKKTYKYLGLIFLNNKFKDVKTQTFIKTDIWAKNPFSPY